MLIQVNAIPADAGVGAEQFIRDTVAGALDRMEARITRVDIHVSDTNGPKGGVDKFCSIEARPAGRTSVAATAQGDSLAQAVTDAAEKLSRLLTRDKERRGAFAPQIRSADEI